jgi:hypothetical protein
VSEKFTKLTLALNDCLATVSEIARPRKIDLTNAMSAFLAELGVDIERPSRLVNTVGIFNIHKQFEISDLRIINQAIAGISGALACMVLP